MKKVLSVLLIVVLLLTSGIGVFAAEPPRGPVPPAVCRTCNPLPSRLPPGQSHPPINPCVCLPPPPPPVGPPRLS